MKEMELHRIAVGAISVGSRMRSVNAERVATLTESIKALGLQTPISVWASDDGAEVHLVAGAHRLAAAKKLGWKDIACALVSMNELDRRRWEIAENLHRSELTALERSEHVAEWVRLTEEADKKEQEKQSVDLSQSATKPGRQRSGIRKAADELGIDKDAAHRAVRVASLTEEAKETAREVGLDNNRSALLKAASKPAEQQSQALREIAAAKAQAQHVPPDAVGSKRPEPNPILSEAWEPDEDEEAQLAQAEADYAASIDKVMAADDRLAAAHEEIKRQANEIAALKVSRDGYLNGKAAVTQLLKKEQRKVASLSKQLDAAKAEIERLKKGRG